MNTTNLYREWASKVNHRKGLMLPISAIKTIQKQYNPGYSSVYMFDEESATKIMKSGNSKGMNKYPVYTDELAIDIDDPKDLAGWLVTLSHMNLYHTVYESGGKGYHIVIPLSKMVSGYEVPYSQSEWVKNLDLPCDMSLYQAGRLISLPGRVHAITGKLKKLINTYYGQPLELPLIKIPEFRFNKIEQNSDDSLKLGLAQLDLMASNPPTPGNRHMAIFAACKSLAEGGIEYEVALSLMITINNSWPNPKTSLEVEAAVKGAYEC